MFRIDDVPSDAKLRQLFREATFGARVFCPQCGTSHVERSEDRYRCGKCRKPFSIKSASWLGCTKLSFRKIWILLCCWQEQYTLPVAASMASVSVLTARRWYRRFRQYLVYVSPEKLEGNVEIDESFVGRKRYKNQRIVLGAWSRELGKVIMRIVPNRDQGTTDRFLLKHVDELSTVHTDSAKCYQGIDEFFGYIHETCNHSKFVFGPTNRIEGIWSILKRHIRRTYHHVWKEHLPELLWEIEARINTPQMFQNPLTYLQTSLVAVPGGL